MLGAILEFIKRNGEAGFALVSLVMLSFIAGAAFDFFKIFPAPSLQNGFLAAEAVRERFMEGEPEFQSNIWHPTRHAGRGVTKLDEARAYPGVTLYTSADAQRAYLVDLKGNIVHQWEKTFREVWPDPPHVSSVVPPQNITYRRVIAQANGDLLVVADGVGSTPYGYGLFKLDKNSNVIWRYAEPVHHDVDVGDDGKIYTLIHYNEAALPDAGPVRNIETPFIDDYLVVLSPDGEELERVNLTQALLNSPYAHLLRREKERPDDRRDPLHNNTVKVLSKEMALVHPYGKPGQVLLSMKSLHLVALVDVELKQVVWGTWGPWRAQHDPRFLENGNMLLFDNRGHLGEGGRSRILEFEPQTSSVVWSYNGTPDDRFNSDARGMAQRLPNGNTLITESNPGRLFEVTLDGETVWEFIVPVRGGEGDQLIPVVTSGFRYDLADLPFLSSN